MKHPLLKKWLWCALPALLAAAMYLLLPHLPGFTERVITRGVFRVISYPIEWLMSLFPFSLTEIVVVLLAPTVLTLVTVWIVRLSRHPDRRRQIAERGVRFAAWVLSLMLLVFMVMDGGNFYRYPLGELMELPNRQYTAEELYSVTTDLAGKASAARERLIEDADGYTVLSVSQTELLKLADDCYAPLREQYPYLISGTRRVKPVILSHWWSYTGYTGVYCPWLGESSVNIDMPPCELGHTAAHEIAHTMGFAKENECNFLAWLACAESGQPDYAYSGYLSAYIYCSNALYKADQTLWKQAYTACSEGMRRDLKQRSRYWKPYTGQVMTSSQKVNDGFIKANRVKSGVISYDEMVELVLRYYDAQGML